MKKIFGCLLLSLYMLTANGQYFYLEAGKVLSNFDYKNSAGNAMSKLSGSNQNNMALGFRMSLFYTPWHVSFGSTYSKYVVKGSDPVLGNYYEWDVAFVGANMGLEYEFFKPPVTYNEQHGFSFYLRGSAAADFLVKGSQQVNNQISDLKGKEEFDKPIFFLKGSVGTNYYITKSYIIFAQYSFGKSFLLGNYTNQEQLRFTTHNFSVGLLINLAYSN